MGAPHAPCASCRVALVQAAQLERRRRRARLLRSGSGGRVHSHWLGFARAVAAGARRRRCHRVHAGRRCARVAGRLGRRQRSAGAAFGAFGRATRALRPVQQHVQLAKVTQLVQRPPLLRHCAGGGDGGGCGAVVPPKSGIAFVVRNPTSHSADTWVSPNLRRQGCSAPRSSGATQAAPHSPVRPVWSLSSVRADQQRSCGRAACVACDVSDPAATAHKTQHEPRLGAAHSIGRHAACGKVGKLQPGTSCVVPIALPRGQRSISAATPGGAAPRRAARVALRCARVPGFGGAFAARVVASLRCARATARSRTRFAARFAAPCARRGAVARAAR